VKQRWLLVGCVALAVMVTVGLVGTAATSTLFGTRYRIGETVQFKIEDSTTWFWNCCCTSCCEETLVLGWRIVAANGVTVYNVAHDAGVPGSAWQGSWTQIDMEGLAIGPGLYTLYVDTSAGTLSRCLTIYDPCYRCYDPCSTCSCEQVTAITNCSCKVSLVFVDPCRTTGCISLFGWFGCGCGTCTWGCCP